MNESDVLINSRINIDICAKLFLTPLQIQFFASIEFGERKINGVKIHPSIKYFSSDLMYVFRLYIGIKR